MAAQMEHFEARILGAMVAVIGYVQYLDTRAAQIDLFDTAAQMSIFILRLPRLVTLMLGVANLGSPSKALVTLMLRLPRLVILMLG